jgi:hypothetical protein
MLPARGADVDLAPSNKAVLSPRQMLVRCSLHQMLEPIEPEVVTISDDEQADAAAQPTDIVVKRLESES